MLSTVRGSPAVTDLMSPLPNRARCRHRGSGYSWIPITTSYLVPLTLLPRSTVRRPGFFLIQPSMIAATAPSRQNRVAVLTFVAV